MLTMINYTTNNEINKNKALTSYKTSPEKHHKNNIKLKAIKNNF